MSIALSVGKPFKLCLSLKHERLKLEKKEIYLDIHKTNNGIFFDNIFRILYPSSGLKTIKKYSKIHISTFSALKKKSIKVKS